MSELNFIVLTGRFAAGKDTQALLLAQKFGETSEIVSTGPIYLSAKSGTGEFARFHSYVAPYIEDVDVYGKLLPDSVMTKIVEDVIAEKVAGGKETFIFPGFPRTLGQLEFFNKMISNFRKEHDVKSIFIEYAISDELTLERTHKRRLIAEGWGETIRPWDTDEGVQKRVLTYHAEIEPMIEKLKEEGLLISIDASRTTEEIRVETELRISKNASERF